MENISRNVRATIVRTRLYTAVRYNNRRCRGRPLPCLTIRCKHAWFTDPTLLRCRSVCRPLQIFSLYGLRRTLPRTHPIPPGSHSMPITSYLAKDQRSCPRRNEGCPKGNPRTRKWFETDYGQRCLAKEGRRVLGEERHRFGCICPQDDRRDGKPLLSGMIQGRLDYHWLLAHCN